MAKMNKVCVNLDQSNASSGGFTDAEKATARTNIGASQINYNNTVTDMTVTKEIIRPYMNTKYAATLGSDSFLLLPSSFADGMVVKSNDSLQTQSIPTIKNTHYINYINDPGSLSEAAYTEMTDAISNSEPVVIVSATGSSASYLQFTRQDSTGYYFTGYNSSNGVIMEMHIAGTRAVTITTRAMVPNNGTLDQVLTWNGTTYEWQDPFKYQAGHNISTRSSGNVKSPYMDVDMMMKSSYATGFGTAADTTSDRTNEISLAGGQLTLEVHHYQRTSTANNDKVSFRIKINQGHGLNIFGRYTEVGDALPDSMGIWGAAVNNGTYAELYAPGMSGNVFFPEQAPSNAKPYMIELHLTWVNSKHSVTFADITILRGGYLNGLAHHEAINCVYQTMTSSTGDV